ncbi:hypothetical protein PGT21_019849 [Puccinia graminis f. sp. tritici]|uniref:FCH domain-containing protein n=1 Tax=Puccinia graminis f. sp. tritici TaxID=56615 RepID=A0A5B0MP28_PUCGR|nr:hypothetical protein PGT21_019849 [Puccinia graminis f. sp. tritici]
MFEPVEAEAQTFLAHGPSLLIHRRPGRPHPSDLFLAPIHIPPPGPVAHNRKILDIVHIRKRETRVYPSTRRLIRCSRRTPDLAPILNDVRFKSIIGVSPTLNWTESNEDVYTNFFSTWKESSILEIEHCSMRVMPIISSIRNKNRHSSKLLDDLRLWFKERASIEGEYAKRLTKLTKNPLFEIHHHSNNNELEVGGIKRAPETVRDTTRQSAHSHIELAGTIRTALEKKVAEFVTRREGLKKNDATTNPSFILAAVKKPAYAKLIDVIRLMNGTYEPTFETRLLVFDGVLE